MKMDKKTIIAIVLGVMALAVVLYQFRGIFSSGKGRVASVAPPKPAPAAAPVAATAASEAEPMPEKGYAAVISNVKETDLAFGSRRFKNPMTALVQKVERTRPRVTGPATRVTAARTEALAMGYSIEGIVWNGVSPLALVNNQVVGIGEKLEDGELITEITRDTVRFTRDGQKFYLVLREE